MKFILCGLYDMVIWKTESHSYFLFSQIPQYRICAYHCEFKEIHQSDLLWVTRLRWIRWWSQICWWNGTESNFVSHLCVFKRFYSKDLTRISETVVHAFRVFESTLTIVFLLRKTSSSVSFDCSSICFSLHMSFETSISMIYIIWSILYDKW